MAAILTLTLLLVVELISSTPVLHNNQFRNTETDEFLLRSKSTNEQELAQTAALLTAEQSRKSNHNDDKEEFKDFGFEELSNKADEKPDEKLKKEIEDLVMEYKKASEEKTKKGKELKDKIKVLESLKEQPVHVQEAALEQFQSYLDKRKKFDDLLDKEIKDLERKIDESTSPTERKQLMAQLKKMEKLRDQDTDTLELFFEHYTPGSATPEFPQTGGETQPPQSGSGTKPPHIIINIISGNGQDDDDDDVDDCWWDIFDLLCKKALR